MFNNVSRGYRRAQLCPTLCNPMDYRPPGSSVHGILQASTEVRLTFYSPEDITNPGVKPWSPALQADSSSSKSPGKPQIPHSTTKESICHK